MVHIADVSHYVKECSEIDKEALNRATSIYLVDRVIPMLPEKLSNGICSLNEGVTRLVLSAIMEYDSFGNRINGKITRGYIKSKHRMTYSNVNKILIENDEALIKKYADIYPMLKNMLELSKLIRAKRVSRGALDFDVAEAKIVVDEKGKPTNIIPRARDKAEMLIEDFMLEANEMVAETLFNLEYPCCYRVHENPSKEKLKTLNTVLKSFGLHIRNIEKDIKPKDLQIAMNKIDDDKKDVANALLLRAMAKARYDASCLGHYGLALKYYCHFTSPIRRYPDLQTHRIINALLFDLNDFDNQLEHFRSTINDVCMRSSLCEKKAIELERTVDDMKMAEYMENKIGNIYSGVITSITNYGFYVMLDNLVEGLVHIKNMPDFFEYDDIHLCLVGNYSKDVYNIGDKVKVRVIGASKKLRQIDFAIVSHNRQKGKKL